MDKKDYSIAGYPFFDKDGYPCVCKNADGNKIHFIRKINNRYYSAKETFAKFPPISNDVFKFFELYALINSVDESIDVFGERQRKENVIGSLLLVQFYAYDKHPPFFYVVTGREDGASVRMLTTDVGLMFPVISKKLRKPTDVKVGDTVIACKDHECGKYNKGDKFKVNMIEKSAIMSTLDVYTLANDFCLVVEYAKNFKPLKS